MEDEKPNEDENLSAPYEIKIFSHLLYVKFGQALVESHLDSLDEMVETVVGLENLVRVFVIDLYELETFDIRCIRALVLAQNTIRQRSGFKLIVVQPEREILRKQLIDKMVIRDAECIISREKLFLYLKTLTK